MFGQVSYLQEWLSFVKIYSKNQHFKSIFSTCNIVYDIVALRTIIIIASEWRREGDVQDSGGGL